MNGRKRRNERKEPLGSLRSRRYILAAFFGLGLILGCLLASWMDEGTNKQLAEYLNGFLTVLEQGKMENPGFQEAAWEVFRWPLAAWLVGFTAFRVIAIPVLFCGRGFLLSYSVSVMIRILGWKGLAVSSAIFGIPALFSVTALFLCGEELMNRGPKCGEGDPARKR